MFSSISSSRHLPTQTFSLFQVGPQLKYSYPPGCMSNEAFETVSDYVIVSREVRKESMLASVEGFEGGGVKAIYKNSVQLSWSGFTRVG